MLPNKHVQPVIVILGFLLGVSLSFTLRDYPILRIATILCLALMFMFLIERGEV